MIELTRGQKFIYGLALVVDTIVSAAFTVAVAWFLVAGILVAYNAIP